MERQVKDFDEFKNIFEGQGYKYLGLFNSAGGQLVPYNNSKVKASQRIEEIKRRLSVPGVAGVFVIKCKNSPKIKGVVTDDYYIKLGQTMSEAGPVHIHHAPKVQEAERVLTYEGALETQTELISLRLENEQLIEQNRLLGEKVEELNKEIDELSNQVADGMSESASSPWEGILAAALPAYERFMEDRKEQRALEMYKLNAQNNFVPNPGTMHQATQERPPGEMSGANPAERADGYLHELMTNDPEAFQEVENKLYNYFNGQPDQTQANEGAQPQ